MMSMNCLLMKSSMATSSSAGTGRSGLLLRCSELLRLGFALVDLLLEPRERNRAGDQRAVGEQQRRRRGDLELATEHRGLLDRVRAVALVVGQLARVEELVPRLHLVRGAPDDG